MDLTFVDDCTAIYLKFRYLALPPAGCKIILVEDVPGISASSMNAKCSIGQGNESLILTQVCFIPAIFTSA